MTAHSATKGANTVFCSKLDERTTLPFAELSLVLFYFFGEDSSRTTFRCWRCHRLHAIAVVFSVRIAIVFSVRIAVVFPIAIVFSVRIAIVFSVRIAVVFPIAVVFSVRIAVVFCITSSLVYFDGSWTISFFFVL